VRHNRQRLIAWVANAHVELRRNVIDITKQASGTETSIR
jgi:hypothetical protein